MKKLAISVISNTEEIIIINLTKSFLESLKKVIEISQNVSKNSSFDEDIYYTLPFSFDTIYSYKLRTTYLKDYETNMSNLDGKSPEYLTLSDEERFSFAKKHSIDSDLYIFNDNKTESLLKNFIKNGDKGELIIEKNIINLKCKKYDFLEEILSDSFSYENLLQIIENEI